MCPLVQLLSCCHPGSSVSSTFVPSTTGYVLTELPYCVTAFALAKHVLDCVLDQGVICSFNAVCSVPGLEHAAWQESLITSLTKQDYNSIGRQNNSGKLI